jgi:hypothetical protein
MLFQKKSMAAWGAFGQIFLTISKLHNMKNQIVHLLLAAALLLYSAATLKAQLASFNCQVQRTYTATQNGKEVGWLRISGVENGSERILKTESNLLFQLLFSFDAKAWVTNRFIGNTLTQAIVFRTLNGKVKLDNDFQLRDGYYKAIKGDADVATTKPIYRTVTTLYIMEPIGVTEVFSEVYLRFIPVEKIASSEYRTPLPDGGVMTYTYIQGQLVTVVANTSLATVLFQLKQ